MKYVLGLLLVGAATPLWATPDLQAATDDVCNCMAEPNRVAQQALELIRHAQASGDTSRLMAAQGEMMGVMTAASRCFEQLPGKYPEINRSDELKNRVMDMANQQCPNPATRMYRQR